VTDRIRSSPRSEAATRFDSLMAAQRLLMEQPRPFDVDVAEAALASQ
jgi:hypothetical protein